MKYALTVLVIYSLLILGNSRDGCDVLSYAHSQRTVFICDKQARWGREPF
jgi:hypothetical protein